ncbi:MAG: 3-deoxy-7-phosphoheptulonate synthase, partial [Chloroflexia bacterium]|nr:3-deoxy-7-phosphoheptulonate synthase [Chloroflexia bacterium]
SPDHALSDGAQSLNLDEFAALMPQLARVAQAVDRTFTTAGVEVV